LSLIPVLALFALSINDFLSKTLFVLIVFALVFLTDKYFSFEKHLVWKSNGYEGYAKQTLNFDFNEAYTKQNFQTELTTRPKRESLNPAINASLLLNQFGVLGNDAGSRILKNLIVTEASDLITPKKSSFNEVLEFLKRPSSFIILPASKYLNKSALDTEDVNRDIIECLNDQNNRCESKGQIEMLNYNEDSTRLKVSLLEDSIVVENELFFPTWSADLTSNHKINPAFEVVKSLRAYQFPAGNYEVMTFYRPPLWRIASFLTLIGVILLLSNVFTALKSRWNQ